jgi:hypothetical protein
VAAVSNAFEQCKAVLIAGDRLPVDDAGARAKASECLDDEREAVSQVVARPALQPDSLAVLAGNHAKAVVLDLVQPDGARRRLRG